MDIDPQKIITSPFLPGIFGAWAGLKFAPGISRIEKVTNIAAGMACAGFVAPAAGEVFKLSSVAMMSGLAFVIGMFGMSIAAAVMQGLRDLRVGEIISGWVSRKG